MRKANKRQNRFALSGERARKNVDGGAVAVRRISERMAHRPRRKEKFPQWQGRNLRLHCHYDVLRRVQGRHEFPRNRGNGRKSRSAGVQKA